MANRDKGKISWILFSALLISLASCAGPLVSKETVTIQNKEKIVYIIPQGENISGQSNVVKGLNFVNTKDCKYWTDGGVAELSGIDVVLESTKNMLTVTSYNGKCYSSNSGTSQYASYVRYFIEINLIEEGDKFLITLIPSSMEIAQVENPDSLRGISYAIPKFSEQELIKVLGMATIEFQIEIDSSYNTESIYANFRRLLEESPLREPYKDTITGKIYKSAYMLTYNNKSVRLFTDVYPYRNGSKAVIKVLLPLSIDSSTNTANVVKQINDVKQELEKIVQG